MLTENEKLALLDKWTDKELSIPELTRAMQMMDEAELEKTTAEHGLARLAIEKYGLTKAVEEVHNKYVKKYKADKKAKSYSLFQMSKRIMQVAASIIILLGVFILGNVWFTDNTTLYNKLNQTYYITNERSVSDEQRDSMVLFFKQGNYAAVAQYFKQIQVPTAREWFFAGYSALQTNEIQLSIELFEALLLQNTQTGMQLYQDDAEYYLAMACLKADKRNRAYELLSTIYENPEHTYQQNVKKRDLLLLGMKRWL